MRGQDTVRLLSGILVGLLAVQVSPPALALADSEGATSAPTTLFFHVSGFQDFPINTQEPDAAYSEDVNIGMATNTLTCLPATPGTSSLSEQAYSTSYGFASPGLVDYNATDEQGAPIDRPRYHPERGLALDAELDPQSPPVLHWYLSTATPVTSPPGSGLASPVVVPEVVVRGTLREGDEITVGKEGYNAGESLAQGESAPAVLAMDRTQGAQWSVVDGVNVYEFAVPLAFSGGAVIPRATGFSLRVDVFVKIPPCPGGDDAFMPNVMRTHTSPDHRPRLETVVVNALSIPNEPIVQAADPNDPGLLAFQAVFASPWGAYDVPQPVLRIEGPAGAFDVPSLPSLQRSHEHGHYGQDPQWTIWVWNATEAGAPGGDYTAVFSAANLQGTATTTTRVPFHVAGDTPVPSPLWLVLVALGIGAVLSRRR